MKKILVLLLALFMSISTATAAIDIAAALQSGQSETSVFQELTASGMTPAEATEAMVKAAPDRAAAITFAAVTAAPKHAAAIEAAAKRAAPKHAAAIMLAARDARVLAGLPATAAGVPLGVPPGPPPGPLAFVPSGGGGSPVSP